MGNDQGNCYEVQDDANNPTHIKIMEQVPTQNPITMDSTNNESPPNIIGHLDMDFQPHENDPFNQKDPLSSKDPDDLDAFKSPGPGHKIKFDGKFQNDKFEGEGTFQFKNGDYFKGMESCCLRIPFGVYSGDSRNCANCCGFWFGVFNS